MVQHFSEEQKRRAVDLYFEGGGNSTVVVKALGYPSVTALLEWVRKDPRCALPDRHCARYSFDEKMLVVDAYLDGTLTLEEAARLAGSDASQAARWVKKYLRRGPEALKPKNRKGVPCPHKDRVRPEETPLESEVSDEDLRGYCEQLKFENDVLRAELELFSKKAGASARKNSPRETK
ncbi:MAG: helix-turn-helix domain-containing protein [Coriobacteriia bacterium]